MSLPRARNRRETTRRTPPAPVARKINPFTEKPSMPSQASPERLLLVFAPPNGRQLATVGRFYGINTLGPQAERQSRSLTVAARSGFALGRTDYCECSAGT